MSYPTPEEWSDEENELFSRMYRHMESNQHLFTHIEAARVPPEHWQVTCFNAAWFAVACAAHEPPWEHFDDNGVVIGAEVPLESMN